MIKAKSILASLANGVAIHTVECILPTSILNQLLNHRAMSTSTSSCRAIPIKSSIEQMLADPATPIWTAKNKGMSGPIITDPAKLATINALHKTFMANAMTAAMAMDDEGVHKQNAGRYLAPFQNSKLLITATDWANLDWLRIDSDTQPEFQELAKAIKAARDGAEVMELGYGEYHLPHIARHRAINDELEYYIEDDEGYTKLSLEEAIMVSMSINAQTSYRNADGSIGKAKKINEVLFNGNKVHASPSEHIATPMQSEMVRVIADSAKGIDTKASLKDAFANLPKGVSAINADGTIGSGNFTNWIQHRHTLPNHDGGIGEHVKTEEPEDLPEEIQEILSSLKEAFGDDVDITATEVPKSDGPTRVDMPLTREEFEALSEDEQKSKIEEQLDLLLSKITKH